MATSRYDGRNVFLPSCPAVAVGFLHPEWRLPYTSRLRSDILTEFLDYSADRD